MKHYIESGIIALAAIFAPVKAIMIVTAVTILGDLVLGILAAKKRGEPITSAGLRRTIVKLFVYEVALAFGFLGETYLTDAVPVTKIIGGLVFLTEGLSVFENLNTISGQDVFKSVIEKLGSRNALPKKEDDK